MLSNRSGRPAFERTNSRNPRFNRTGWIVTKRYDASFLRLLWPLVMHAEVRNALVFTHIAGRKLCKLLGAGAAISVKPAKPNRVWLVCEISLGARQKPRHFVGRQRSTFFLRDSLIFFLSRRNVKPAAALLSM